MEREYQIMLEGGRIVTWLGVDGLDACRRAADCLGVSVTAWREAPVLVAAVHHSQIIG